MFCEDFPVIVFMLVSSCLVFLGTAGCQAGDLVDNLLTCPASNTACQIRNHRLTVPLVHNNLIIHHNLPITTFF